MTYMVQIGDEVREATPDEAAVIDAQRQALAERETQAAAQLAAKQSARAKLAALGLDDEEIHALLGI